MGFWDRGVDALKEFGQAHACNALCIVLELDDLDELDTIVMNTLESQDSTGEVSS